jgi:hypothetical protein
MANLVYPKALESYSFPSILLDNIKVLLTRGYTPITNTDQYLSDISGAAKVANSPNLGGKTLALGVFKASNTSFGVVAAGAACDGLVVYQDSGNPATSHLLCFIDTGYTGLPVTPDGVNVVSISWPAAGIFQI